MLSLLPQSPPAEAKPESTSTTTTTTAIPGKRSQSRTSVHIMALDSIVNVNSLFTLALFLGLTWYPASLASLSSSPSCVAPTTVAEAMIAFHVYSFSSFLFSSLIALALKQAIRTGHGEAFVHLKGHVNGAVLRLGMLFSGLGSVFGCGFLMMALVDLVQIKLGTLACRGFHTFAALVPLLVLVPFGLFVYVCLVLHAFTR